MAHTLHKLDLRHLKAVARVLTGRAPSIAEVAEREESDAGSVRGSMRLAFLAPKNVEMIAAAGRQPSKRTEASTERIDLPPLDRARRSCGRLIVRAGSITSAHHGQASCLEPSALRIQRWNRLTRQQKSRSYMAGKLGH